MLLGACRQGKLLFLHWAFSREIGAFKSFVKTRGAGKSPKQRQQKSHRKFFHWNLIYFLNFTDTGIANYASFRSILHILVPCNKISFNRINLFILKCWYWILLFRSLTLASEQFLPSFFFIRNNELKNWSYLGSQTTIAPFPNMCWTSWLTKSNDSLVNLIALVLK